MAGVAKEVFLCESDGCPHPKGRGVAFIKIKLTMSNVSQTSIETWHKPETQEMSATQFQRVAAYVVAQTKAGKESCIGSVWEDFSKHERKGLGQISTVSRVCNDLAKPDAKIIVGGKEYRYEPRPPKKHGRNAVKHFCLILKHKTMESGEQIELNF